MAAQSDLRFTFTVGSDIAAAVLKKHALTLDYELRATYPHETREYCVQGPMTKSAAGAGNSPDADQQQRGRGGRQMHGNEVTSRETFLQFARYTRALRLIRDARRLGFKKSDDLIAQVRAGKLDLYSHFATYSDAIWKRLVVDLPPAKDYS